MLFGILSSRLLVIGAITMMLGVAQFVIGFGLWQLTPRSRKLAEILCWFYVALASVNIVGNAYMRLRGFAVDAENAIEQFVGLLWQLLWALYLGRESTREAFLRRIAKHTETPGSP